MPPPHRHLLRFLFITTIICFILASNICLAVEEIHNDDLEAIMNDLQTLQFENTRLSQAYIALQSWKKAIFSDPFNFTANWNGPNVCSYGGVYCAPLPTDASMRVVAGIDLNHADIAGYLPNELGLLTDLALFHINSNRFCGVVPPSFKKLKLLFELDLSNNRFVGGFPEVVLSLPELKFLDLRFNDFEGPVPLELFNKKLDALFLNDNRFKFGIPQNLGNSPVSVLVFANNDLGGCIPASIGKMGKTLNEIILMNDNLTGCLPPQIGLLKKLTVFDVSFNNLQGPLPPSVGSMKSLEQLNVAHNRFTGVIPQGVCQLPSLQNFTYSFNYFTGEAPSCAAAFGPGKSGLSYNSKNCIPGKSDQRSAKECSSEASKPYDCRKSSCFVNPNPPKNVAPPGQGSSDKNHHRAPPPTSSPPGQGSSDKNHHGAPAPSHSPPKKGSSDKNNRRSPPPRNNEPLEPVHSPIPSPPSHGGSDKNKYHSPPPPRTKLLPRESHLTAENCTQARGWGLPGVNDFRR
ncbi:hypothetical protein Leryth_001012 [Lithospermum erythrorhizon]|nr:hypothetical protein Leryth_001012 [Lithospermum erythrorhizon]